MKKYGNHEVEERCDMDYSKPDREPKHDMDCKPYPEEKHEMETIVKCGMGVSPGPLCRDNVLVAGVLNSIPGDGDGYNREAPVIASVVLDTHSLKDPTVKIDFSSIISFKTNSSNYFLRLTFKLSKVCDGGHPERLAIWTFEKGEQYQEVDPAAVQVDGNARVQETDFACFTWCQCEGCPGCCTYKVELVDQDCYNIEFATISNIFITGIANGIKKY